MTQFNRESLPFRVNCEGYFLYSGEVIVRDSGEGYLEFPGGGVDAGESPENALIRETYEETGAVIESLKSLGTLRFVWDENWAKTDKQKKRYSQFQGEEMHFFTGRVIDFRKPTGDGNEAGWCGRRTMPVLEALEFIKAGKPYSKELADYRKKQEEILLSLS